MEQDTNLTPDSVDSPSVDQGYVDQSSPLDRLAMIFDEDTSTEQSSDVEVEEYAEDEGSEDVAVDEVVEADDTPEETYSEDEDDDADENDAPDNDANEELGYVDYEDTKGKLFPVKVKGEVKWMSFDEMQNDVARASSANKQTTEAKELMEQVDARNAEVDTREESLKQREQLLGANAQLSVLSVQYNEAMSKGDNDKANQIAHQYQQLEAQVKQATDSQYNEKVDQQRKAIAESNYSYLLDADKRGDFVDFIGKLPTDTQDAVTHDAELMKMAEDARKWRDSQKKGKSTKLPAKKSIPDSKAKGPNKQKQEIARQRKEMRSGTPSHQTRNAVLGRIGNFLDS